MSSRYRFSPQFTQNVLAKLDPRDRKLTLDNFIVVSVQVNSMSHSQLGGMVDESGIKGALVKSSGGGDIFEVLDTEDGPNFASLVILVCLDRK